MKKSIRFPNFMFAAAALMTSSCDKPAPQAANNPGVSGVTREAWGKMPDGREVALFTLTNANGLRARVTEYGAILVSMEIPDREGKSADVTHGYDTLDGWLTNTSYFGSTVGRFANRIAHGKFTLDGKEYSLATNNSPGGIPCHLHGGETGFDKVLWAGTAIGDGVELTYVSKDGEEGYPGKLSVKVTYRLTEDNELIWKAEATTDAPTVINMAHHSYWNLSGDPAVTIDGHELMLAADHFLPTDAGLIPTGEIAPVSGTPMDFTSPTTIGKRVNDDFEALRFGGGYDHAWVLRKGGESAIRTAARLRDPASGRVMEILTDQLAIQFYGGNFLDGTVTGKNGVKYAFRTALCLETENFPDAPNKPGFPSAVLRPGETYTHTMIHRFLVD
jgi:aldose 1-epimerase